MTTAATRFGLKFLGALALSIFVAMVVILNGWVKPETGFLPQSALRPYGTDTLTLFGNDLKEAGLTGLYRMTLIYLDSAFMILFALWCALSHLAKGGVAWRWIGIAIALAALGLDFAEGQLILQGAGLKLPDPAPMPLPIGPSPVYPVTLAKLAAYLLCLLSVWRLRSRRG